MNTGNDRVHETLVAQLERLYAVERRLHDELATLSEDVAIDTLDDLRVLECREQLQYVIDRHRTETDRHVERIERAFDALEETPTTRRVPELEGLFADKETFNNVVLNDGLRPLYYIETILKLEALECTIYGRTVDIADELEEGETVVDVLEESYADARERRTDIESLADGDAVLSLLTASIQQDGRRTGSDRLR
ncbi:YciE/YciF ferroxidase family protein [Natrarchaeobius chitinivorans]|uniref:DUF892 family protein n=1 Tax=Natrarchaeobius chitinivorans TaxID=1679083 RepID=A0A3N6N893_NATCH|nr:DUF892 family protein [Natrarchaeobius chitinivorans]RQG94652.1 DUF892 family protein [Natrarchaeobius chitinivorans]